MKKTFLFSFHFQLLAQFGIVTENQMHGRGVSILYPWENSVNYFIWIIVLAIKTQ